MAIKIGGGILIPLHISPFGERLFPREQQSCHSREGGNPVLSHDTGLSAWTPALAGTTGRESLSPWPAPAREAGALSVVLHDWQFFSNERHALLKIDEGEFVRADNFQVARFLECGLQFRHAIEP